MLLYPRQERRDSRARKSRPCASMEHNGQDEEGECERERLSRLFVKSSAALARRTAQKAGLNRFASSTTRLDHTCLLLLRAFRLIRIVLEVRVPPNCVAVCQNVIAAVGQEAFPHGTELEIRVLLDPPKFKAPLQKQ
jgi:hypothetical protein